MSKLVLLDRDGVLNVDRPNYVLSISELEIEPLACEGLALLCSAGFTCVVCSNQACVGKGLISPEDLVSLNDELARRLNRLGGVITTFYICPHNSDEKCNCRKPKPGLLLRALADHKAIARETYFVGDAVRDVEAAHAAHVNPALLATGKGRASAQQLPEIPYFTDLLAFAKHLTAL